MTGNRKQMSDYVARPLSIYAVTYGIGQVSEEQIEKAVSDCMDLTPRGIRTHLGLNKLIYQRTTAHGHFGSAPNADGGFSWVLIDRCPENGRLNMVIQTVIYHNVTS